MSAACNIIKKNLRTVSGAGAGQKKGAANPLTAPAQIILISYFTTIHRFRKLSGVSITIL